MTPVYDDVGRCSVYQNEHSNLCHYIQELYTSINGPVFLARPILFQELNIANANMTFK